MVAVSPWCLPVQTWLQQTIELWDFFFWVVRKGVKQFTHFVKSYLMDTCYYYVFKGTLHHHLLYWCLSEFVLCLLSERLMNHIWASWFQIHCLELRSRGSLQRLIHVKSQCQFWECQHQSQYWYGVPSSVPFEHNLQIFHARHCIWRFFWLTCTVLSELQFYSCKFVLYTLCTPYETRF